MEPKPLSRKTEASDPSTSPARLSELAKLGCSREVAGNPNTPVALLLKLAARHFDAFLANPILPLLLLEDPGFCAKIPLSALRRLMRRLDLPPSFLQTLQRHPDEEIRDAARLHVSMDCEQANSQDCVEAKLRAARGSGGRLPVLLECDAVPIWLLEPLGGAPRADVRRMVFERLKGDEHSALREMFRAAGTEAPTPDRPAGMAENIAPELLARLASGGLWAQRQAASHPQTPPAVLARLARCESAPISTAASRNPSLPEQEFWRQATMGNVNLRRAIVCNPAIPAALLNQMAADKDSEVRCRIAVNRATPPETLALLAADPVEKVRVAAVKHRALPHAAMERALSDSAPAVRMALVRNANVPSELLERLARDDSKEVRNKAGRYARLAPETYAELLCNCDGRRDSGVLSNLNIPEEIRHRFYRIPTEFNEVLRAFRGWRPSSRNPRPVKAPAPWKPLVRSWKERRSRETWDILLSLYRETDPERLRECSKHPDCGVREVVAGNGGTPPDALIGLAQDSDIRVRSSMALRNRHLPDEASVILAGDLDDDIRRWIATSTTTPPKLLAGLAGDSSDKVRSAAARNECTPQDTLAILATDVEASVRASLASNRKAPPGIIRSLADEDTPEMRKTLSRNPATPPDVLHRWADTSDLSLLTKLASRSEMPPDWIERQTLHESPDVRASAARNSSISATAFERLARDPSALVRRDLAGNTALPQSMAGLLAGDPVPEVRSTLAQRKDAQPAVIQVLSSDGDPLIRNTIATHPATPDDVRLRIIAAAPSASNIGYSLPVNAVSEQRAIMEKTPPDDSSWYSLAPRAIGIPELLDYVLSHPSPKPRRALLHSPDIPKPLIRRLAEDTDRSVREAVASHAKTPPDLLERLSLDPEDSIRWYLIRNPLLPTELLARMALNSNDHSYTIRVIRTAAIKHPGMPIDVLEKLAALEIERLSNCRGRGAYHGFEQPDGVLALIARPDIPIAWFERLVTDNDPSIQLALVRRADLPDAWRTTMLDTLIVRCTSETGLVPRLAALAHPRLPVAILQHKAKSGLWIERWALTQNPALPKDLLSSLCEDSNIAVRNAARSHEK